MRVWHYDSEVLTVRDRLGSSPGSQPLPNIYPDLSLLMQFVLCTDFTETMRPPTPSEWQEGTDELIRHGLAGLAVRCIHDRSMDVDSKVSSRLRNAQFHDIATTRQMAALSAPGLQGLRTAGIPFVVIKGPGIALASTSLLDRPFIDIDVLVEPSRFTDALAVLSSAGYTESDRTSQPWEFFNRYCREAVNLRSPLGGSIDLHHRIAPWNWTTELTFEMLNKTVRCESVYGIDLPIVSPEHNLLIAALHLVSDKSRPGQTVRVWRDLLVLSRSSSLDQLLDAANTTGLTGWLEWIIGCLPDESRPAGLCSRLTTSPHHLKSARRLRLLLPPHFGSYHMLGQIFRLPVVQAGLFAVGMAVPSPSYLRRRYPNERHRYLRWWRASSRSFERGAEDLGAAWRGAGQRS